MAGNLYALDANDGRKLWNQKLDGALGGDIISYTVKGQQRLAVTQAVKSAIWPTPKSTAQIAVFGLSFPLEADFAAAKIAVFAASALAAVIGVALLWTSPRNGVES